MPDTDPTTPSDGRPPLRIAVVGAGAIGRRHAALIQRAGGCALAAIVDPSPDAQGLASALGVPHRARLADLLASDPPDGAIVATPNPLHADQALECIAAGVAVLVEKPVAHTVQDAERLAVAVRDAGARVLVGHHRAHSPILARAREVVRQGRLGRIVAVSGAALFHKPDAYFDAAAWRSQPGGGGPMLINLIHEIGNLRSLCGEIVAVQAMASNAVRGSAVEDTAALLLRFADGALGTFLLSDAAASGRSWEQTTGENPDYATYPDEDCYTIVGTRGSLAVPTMRLASFGDGQARSWHEPMGREVVGCARRDPLALQLEHFCAVARGEAAPLVSVRDGLQNLRVVDALVRAVRSRGLVEIAP